MVAPGIKNLRDRLTAWGRHELPHGFRGKSTPIGLEIRILFHRDDHPARAGHQIHRAQNAQPECSE
jgi:hypothetical protein